MKKIVSFSILLTLFFLQSYLIRFNIGAYPTNLLEILILISTAFFIIERFKTKQILQTLKNTLQYQVIIAITILILISIATTGTNINIDLIRYVKFFVFAAILTFITLETFKSSETRKSILKAAGLGALAFGIFSIIYNLIGFNVTHDLRLLGPLDSAVYLAYYLAPFSIYFILESFKSKRKSELLFGILLFTIILLTRSIGAIGGVLIVTGLFLLKETPHKFLRTRLFKTIATAIAVIFIVMTVKTKIIPAIETNYSSLNERNEIWQVAIESLQTPTNLIWGLGYGQFQPYFEENAESILNRPPLDTKVLQPHNLFLLSWANFGLLGLIGLMYLIIRTVKTTNTSQLNKILSFMLLYFFLHGQIDTPYFKNDMLLIIILLLEMATINTASKKSAPKLIDSGLT